jgi:sec-independent protein translocase protein TatC
MLRVLGVVDPLSIQIDMALLGGLVGSLPFLLFFLAQFLLPGLTRREARLLVPAFIAGAFLFMGGVAFCYQWILPETLRFFIAYNAHLDFRTEWTVQNYIDFVLQMFLAFGLSFELPLVLLALNRLGLIRAETLRQSRRHAVVILVVLASCVVPATDPFSIGMLVVPMYLLFEVTVWLATLFERRLAAAEKAS